MYVHIVLTPLCIIKFPKALRHFFLLFHFVLIAMLLFALLCITPFSIHVAGDQTLYASLPPMFLSLYSCLYA